MIGFDVAPVAGYAFNLGPASTVLPQTSDVPWENEPALMVGGLTALPHHNKREATAGLCDDQVMSALDLWRNQSHEPAATTVPVDQTPDLQGLPACKAPAGTCENGRRRLRHGPTEAAVGDAHFGVCLRQVRGA